LKSQITGKFLYFIPLPLILLSLLVGPSELVTPSSIGEWFLYKVFAISPSTTLDSELVEAVVLHTRLPRILLAFLVGASLTASGTTLQALFRNPLVSPYILGLSSGAAFGAALALVIPWLPLQPAAFLSGFLAVGMSYLLALRNREVSTVSLILAGIIVSAIFTALLTVVQFLTDPFKLQTIVHWTMGNLHNASWDKVRSSFLPIILGCLWLFLLRWRMNVLALGDEEARAVGLNPQKEKLWLIVPATLVASASVAVSGVIGMVGLVVPHMVRMIVGADNTKTLPISLVFGGSFLLIVDDCSRTLTSFEIPIGIFTTLIGGPFFIYLFKKTHQLFVGV
jgi:iron complex transport system permease protein